MTERWRWTDTGGTLSRWSLWLRSGEFLTTLFLAAYLAVFAQPGNTLAAGPAYRLLFRLTGGDEQPWAAWAFALAIVAPLAVYLDAGRLRVLSLVSQAAFLGILAASFFAANRLGLGWAANGAAAAWLLWRAAALTTHRWRRG